MTFVICNIQGSSPMATVPLSSLLARRGRILKSGHHVTKVSKWLDDNLYNKNKLHIYTLPLIMYLNQKLTSALGFTIVPISI